MVVVVGGTGILGREFQKIRSDFIYLNSDFDIFDFSDLEKKLDEINPKIIINCAAIKSEEVDRKKVDSININIIGSANLSKYCIKNDIRLVYISTDYVYPGKTGNYNELRLNNPQASISGSLTISQQTTGSIVRNNFTTTPYPTNFTASFPNGSLGKITEPTNYVNYLGASKAYIKKVGPNLLGEQKLGINVNGQSVTLGQQATGSITFNDFNTTPYPIAYNTFARPVVSQSVVPTNINPRGFNLLSDETTVLEGVINKLKEKDNGSKNTNTNSKSKTKT